MTPVPATFWSFFLESAIFRMLPMHSHACPRRAVWKCCRFMHACQSRNRIASFMLADRAGSFWLPMLRKPASPCPAFASLLTPELHVLHGGPGVPGSCVCPSSRSRALRLISARVDAAALGRACAFACIPKRTFSHANRSLHRNCCAPILPMSSCR